MTQLPDKAHFRVEEVANYFDVTTRTIYLWIEHGHLKAHRIAGKSIRITRESIVKCKVPYREQLQ